MNDDDIRRGVIKALEAVLHRDLPDATDETKLFEELDLDSTAVLEVLMAIEEEFDLEFDPDTLDMDHLHSIGALTDFIRSERAPAAAATPVER